MKPKLVVLTGLPGTGKSAIAEAVADHLSAPVFAKDRLEAPLLRSGAVPHEQLGSLGYELLTTLADRQLALGQSAVLDSVASTASIRSTWRELADRHRAARYVIECVCSDPDVHRQRLDGRDRGIPGWPELDWSEVERVSGYYARWDEPRLTLDAMAPLADNILRALEYIDDSDGPTVPEPESVTDSALTALLASGEPFDAWDEEWLGVPLRLQPYFSTEVPPRELVGSVRTISLCDGGVVIVDHPRPSEPPQLLAGGHPEAGESLVEALVREIAEETGWLVTPICVFGFVHCRHLDTRRPDWDRPFPDWIDPMFVSRADSFSPDLAKPGEHPSRLVPWAEVGDLPIGEMQTRWLERATELWRASEA